MDGWMDGCKYMCMNVCMYVIYVCVYLCVCSTCFAGFPNKRCFARAGTRVRVQVTAVLTLLAVTRSWNRETTKLETLVTENQTGTGI